VELNQEFLLETFYSYCKRPLHKKYQNVFNAECPVCKEGKSAGRSRRLFYFPLKNYLYCHNCSKSWNPFEWVKEVTSLTVPEILKKNKNKAAGTLTSSIKVPEPVQEIVIEDLPEESIDLTDASQINFYEGNSYVRMALDYCNQRRLFTAINSCKKFYISLKDRVHKNRLVIPFFKDNDIICYQTRSLSSKQFPKYLTKFGEKEVFGLNNINSEIPYIFVFEGPIDSMFVQNGVAIAALTATEHQNQQLNSFFGHELIYVFDNDKNNAQTSNRIQKHIKSGKRTFIWPKEFKEFKDFNELCCKLNLDEIPWKFVTKNSFKGEEALIKFKLSSCIFNSKA
jgi:hypothetical protein